MASISEIRKNRLAKLKKIIAWGFNPYPRTVKRTHTISQALKNFAKLKREKKQIIITGRVTAWRGHGGALFLDIKDGTGKIQCLLKKDKIGEKSFAFFNDCADVGDFMEFRGLLIKTKKGEKTLEASTFKIIAKSLRPLPEKWHGLKDVEERYRKRYLDLLFNDEVKEKFKKRAEIIKAIREFLEKEGFLEVETPMLQPIYGGARARPFKTRLNALNMDFYLRISPELYLKRLLVGGMEKVYDLGKCFRNEGMDKHHNPDFTMLEFYWAYADDKEMMKMTERLFVHILKKVFGKTELEIIDEATLKKRKISFKIPWKRVEFYQLLRRYTKVDYDEVSQGKFLQIAKELGVQVEKDKPKAEIADEIYKKYCRPKIWEPTFIIHHPVGFQPLAKAFEKNPKKLANFQLVAAGIELVNAFAELNDPLEQAERFKEQEKLFKKGLKEAQRIDNDYIEALEYGMPPAAGFGMGIDRLTALLTGSRTLREIILFPAMKPKKTGK